MKPLTLRAAALLLGAVLAAPALAQHAQKRAECEKQLNYFPTSGQSGKDVVWVPTPDELVTLMLKTAKVTANDFVVDLGAGDGKIAIAAAKQFNANSLGIEYNPDMVKLAQCLVKAEGVGNRTRVVQGDIFKDDFSKADVVTMYLLPELNLCVRHRILAMRPGVRVTSHQFNMGDWEGDEVLDFEGRTAYLWIVPARVGGTWSFKEADNAVPPFTLTLSQNFQKVGGEVTMGKSRQPLVGASLKGEDLRFTFTDDKGLVRSFHGKVSGKQITGQLRTASSADASVTGTLQGSPKPGEWTEMLDRCGRFYGK